MSAANLRIMHGLVSVYSIVFQFLLLGGGVNEAMESKFCRCNLALVSLVSVAVLALVIIQCSLVIQLWSTTADVARVKQQLHQRERRYHDDVMQMQYPCDRIDLSRVSVVLTLLACTLHNDYKLPKFNHLFSVFHLLYT